MSEMVERVAQAICGDDNPANILEIHRHRARAAIAAMREPTEGMVEAGQNSGVIYDAGLVPHHVWQAMIDEALK